jgi:signal transduction histidine kinase
MQYESSEPGDPVLSFAPNRRTVQDAPASSANRAREQQVLLASALLARRDAILDAWRAAGEVAGECSVASSLSRVQFNDHIPAVLDCLAHTIQGLPGPLDQSERVCEHGLQRWQQGYPLRDLIREWGQLQVCVADELERYAAAHPSLEPGVMPAARRAWTRLCADGATESATQYWHLHQAESAGHVHDLERALDALKTIEVSRAEGWRRAAHDLRGSVTVVKGAATLLNDSGAAPADPERAEVTGMLNTSISSLHEMLDDLLGLARLEAGHEQRELATFDAAALLRDFCRAAQASAADRGLFLKMDGPDALEVEGDRAKVLRIVQNLFLNAVKYTQSGGIRVTWGSDDGRDTDRWTFSVQDTGPGIDGNDAAPFAQELHGATNVAGEARDAGTDRRRDLPHAVTLPSAPMALPQDGQPGEGIGLSIVKRLCELLDASLELATSPGRGSTFRVILPRAYDTRRA